MPPSPSSLIPLSSFPPSVSCHPSVAPSLSLPLRSHSPPPLTHSPTSNNQLIPKQQNMNMAQEDEEKRRLKNDITNIQVPSSTMSLPIPLPIVAPSCPAADIPTMSSDAMLNPRRVANSFSTPPPVPAHAYQHVKMMAHQARTAAAATNSSSQAVENSPNEGLNQSLSSLALPAPLPHSNPLPPQHRLQQEVLRLQAENASVKDELQALKQRLKQLEEQQSSSSSIPKLSSSSSSSNLHQTDSLSHIQAEQQALAAWQQSQALDIPLPLMKHVQSFDAEPYLRPTLGSGDQLQSDIGSVLDYLKPSKRSESRRANVLSFLKLLVRKSLGAQVYPLGAYALKTYVGQDEVMDVSAFFSRAHENTWLHRIVNALCQEASANHHNSNNIHATNTSSPYYAVSRLSVSFNKLSPYINCCIGSINVKIYGNHVSGLSSLALFERMDLICSQEHLLKRTILLVKCWASSKKILNFASNIITPSSSGDDLFNQIPIEGLLSGTFISTLVLYIFNAYSSSITTPLEGLYRLLYFLKDFDWDEHALTIYGAVTLSSLEQHGPHATNKWEYSHVGPSSWPANTKPTLATEIWKQHLLTPKDTSRPSRTNSSAANSSRVPSTLQSPAQPATRSNSDSHLTSLPVRSHTQPMNQPTTLKGANAATMSPHLRPLNVHSGPPSLQSNASLLASSSSRPHSQSFESDPMPSSNLTGLNASLQLRHSLHSHSFSNMKQFAAPVLSHDPIIDPYENGNGSSPIDSAISPTESANITPVQSYSNIQKMIGNGSLAANTPNASRLGFSSASSPSLIRPSASTKQLNRLPQPIKAPSSSLFAPRHGESHDFSDTDSPPGGDLDEPEDESLGRIGRVGSSNSLDIDDIEGSEYLDLTSVRRSSPLTVDDDHNVDGMQYLHVNMDTPPPTAGSAIENQPLFQRCSLNVLDPVDPSHNLGSTISYKHEYQIRNTLRDGFFVLKNSLQKYAFQLASKLDTAKQQQLQSHDDFSNDADLGSDFNWSEFDTHPVITQIFEEAQIARFKEQQQRELKSKKSVNHTTMVGSNSNSLSSSSIHMSSVSSSLSSSVSTFHASSSSSANTSPNTTVPFTIDSSTLWVTPTSQIPSSHSEHQLFQPAPGPFSASAFSISSVIASGNAKQGTGTDGATNNTSSEGSLFAFDGMSNQSMMSSSSQSVTISPPRSAVAHPNTLTSSFTLNPNSNHFVPTNAPTAPVIVDDSNTNNAGLDESNVHTIVSSINAPSSAAATTAPSASASGDAASSPALDTLSGDLDKIIANLDHARQFETPDLTEDQLVHLIIDLLKERVSVPVGRMGSLLHDATNNHSLPAMLKEHFGGLKRLLERHPDIFLVHKDHPYNPSCSLKPKWFNFAPPRTMANGNSNSIGGMVHNHSSGNLHVDGSLSPAGGASNPSATSGVDNSNSSRRKFQRRRTRTRRTNSGNANSTASTAAVQAVRATLAANEQMQHGHNITSNHVNHSASSASIQPSMSINSVHSSSSSRPTATPVVAIDCEMVGCGPNGFNSMLARVAIVNSNGDVLYDKFVLPTEPVTDYRTHLSGILPHHLEAGTDFRQVQCEVSQIIKHRILVGHGLMSDLQALCIHMPKAQLRDTASVKLFCPVRPLPLKQLVQHHLSHLPEFHQFQEFQHNPIHDARAAMSLYKFIQSQWESMIIQENQQQQQLGHGQHSHSQPSISTMGQGHNNMTNNHSHNHMNQQFNQLQQQQQQYHQSQQYHPSLPQQSIHQQQQQHQQLSHSAYQGSSILSPSSHTHGMASVSSFSSFSPQPPRRPPSSSSSLMLSSSVASHHHPSSHYTSSVPSSQLVYDLPSHKTIGSIETQKSNGNTTYIHGDFNQSRREMNNNTYNYS